MNARAGGLLLAVATAMLAGALGGCASGANGKLDWQRMHHLGCRLDEQPMVRDMLYFGLTIPGGGQVSGAAWQAFEQEVLAAAFPRGYSVLEADGHWRGSGDVMRAEPSRIVSIVHADDSASAARVREVAANYRERFHQESVLRTRDTVCAAF